MMKSIILILSFIAIAAVAQRPPRQVHKQGPINKLNDCIKHMHGWDTHVHSLQARSPQLLAILL